MTTLPDSWSPASVTLVREPEHLLGPGFSLALERSIRSDARGMRLLVVARIDSDTEDGRTEAELALRAWAFAHRFEQADVQPRKSGFVWLSRRYTGSVEEGAKWFDDLALRLAESVCAPSLAKAA